MRARVRRVHLESGRRVERARESEREGVPARALVPWLVRVTEPPTTNVEDHGRNRQVSKAVGAQLEARRRIEREAMCEPAGPGARSKVYYLSYYVMAARGLCLSGCVLAR